MLIPDPKREERKYVNSEVFDITNELLCSMEDAGITFEHVAKKAGVKFHDLKMMMCGERSMTIQMMARIKWAIKTARK